VYGGRRECFTTVDEVKPVDCMMMGIRTGKSSCYCCIEDVEIIAEWRGIGHFESLAVFHIAAFAVATGAVAMKNMP
jgi:hypothetical protein